MIVICTKCRKVFDEPVQPCPECGGVVMVMKHFGSALKWRDE
jgi:rRNA maturation endonuclease Nob1